MLQLANAHGSQAKPHAPHFFIPSEARGMGVPGEAAG
jgi:hypothetical protein